MIYHSGLRHLLLQEDRWMHKKEDKNYMYHIYILIYIYNSTRAPINPAKFAGGVGRGSAGAAEGAPLDDGPPEGHAARCALARPQPPQEGMPLRCLLRRQLGEKAGDWASSRVFIIAGAGTNQPAKKELFQWREVASQA